MTFSDFFTRITMCDFIRFLYKVELVRRDAYLATFDHIYSRVVG